MQIKKSKIITLYQHFFSSQLIMFTDDSILVNGEVYGILWKAGAVHLSLYPRTYTRKPCTKARLSLVIKMTSISWTLHVK